MFPVLVQCSVLYFFDRPNSAFLRVTRSNDPVGKVTPRPKDWRGAGLLEPREVAWAETNLALQNSRSFWNSPTRQLYGRKFACSHCSVVLEAAKNVECIRCQKHSDQFLIHRIEPLMILNYTEATMGICDLYFPKKCLISFGIMASLGWTTGPLPPNLKDWDGCW